jgi:hypothetical protein
MGYAFVFLVAVAVGVGVYVTTVRGGRAITEGFGTDPGSADPGTYVPVTPARPDWQSRLTGFLGLVIAVVVGAIVLAFTLYAGVEWLVELVTDAVGT